MKQHKSQWAFSRVCLWTGCAVVVLAGLLVFYTFISTSTDVISLRDDFGKSLLISNRSPKYQEQLLRQAQVWLASSDKSDTNRAVQTIVQGLHERGIILEARQWEEYFPGIAYAVDSFDTEECTRSSAQTVTCGELIQWRDAESSDPGLNNAIAFLSLLDSTSVNTNDVNEYLICSTTNTSAWQKNPLDRVCLLTSQQVESLANANIRSSLATSGALVTVGTLLLILSLSGFAPDAFLLLCVSDQIRLWLLYLEKITRKLLDFCPILFNVKKLRVCPDTTGLLSDNILNELDTVRLLF
ncbi:MAG: hypothetical protein Q4G59_03885 [Planctomycetia bacterium]|nr:hypothetical protein [Planctomycetia bacterium]